MNSFGSDFVGVTVGGNPPFDYAQVRPKRWATKPSQLIRTLICRRGLYFEKRSFLNGMIKFGNPIFVEIEETNSRKKG